MPPKRKAAAAAVAAPDDTPAAKRPKRGTGAQASAPSGAPGGLTAEAVAKAFSANVFGTGQEYLKEDRIDRTSLKARDTGKGIAISAACTGIGGEEFAMTTTVAPGGKVAGCVCSCLAGKYRRPCRHTCALLLLVAESAPGDIPVQVDAKPPPKSAAKAKAEQKRIQGEMKTLGECSVPQLKDVLRLNKQPVGGTKAELVRRVAEGTVLGAVPRCPECHGGQLRYDGKTGMYTCKGYFDDADFKPCAFTSAAVERRKWRTTEAEPEAE